MYHFALLYLVHMYKIVHVAKQKFPLFFVTFVIIIIIIIVIIIVENEVSWVESLINKENT
jgi:hypothetical protein